MAQPPKTRVENGAFFSASFRNSILFSMTNMSFQKSDPTSEGSHAGSATFHRAGWMGSLEIQLDKNKQSK